MTLLFATAKGTSSGNPDEGNAGEKVGSVGQIGPQRPAMLATNPITAAATPRNHLEARHRRRCRGNGGSDRRCIGGGVFACGLLFAAAFLIRGLCFFTVRRSLGLDLMDCVRRQFNDTGIVSAATWGTARQSSSHSFNRSPRHELQNEHDSDDQQDKPSPEPAVNSGGLGACFWLKRHSKDCLPRPLDSNRKANTSRIH